MNTRQFAGGVFRGPSPQTTEDWLQLKYLGITTCLNLQSGAPLLNDGSPLQEMISSERYGVKTWCLPLGEILPPTKNELELAFKFIFQTPIKGCIYVHCHTGVDRTGMVMAYGRIHSLLGWTKKKAVAEMKDLGMHWWYYWWAWFL